MCKNCEVEKEQPSCFGHPTQESDVCNKCHFIDECVDNMWDKKSRRNHEN